MTENNGKMGLGSCTAAIIAACIGSAIFSISGMTIYYAGASAILSWVIAAVIYGLFGLVLVRLVELFPRSGGIYVFPRRAFGGTKGPALGFFSGWGYIVSSIIGIGFSAIYAGIYLQAGFPSIQSPFAVSALSCLAASVIVINGTGITKKIQNSLVAILLATMGTYCCVAIFGGAFDTANFTCFFSSGAKGSAGFISAVPLAMIAYGGSVVIAFMASEVKNPERNVPRSLILGVGAVAVIYATLLTCIAGTLPMSVMQSDPSTRYIPLFASVTSGSLGAFPWLTKLISISAFLALFTSMVAMMQINSRAMEAIAAEGLLPERYYKKNNKGISTAAVATMTLAGIILSKFPQWTELLITLGAVLSIVSMAITCLSLSGSGKGRGRYLAICVLALLLVCYLPDLTGGGGKMWLFTAVTYLAGLFIWIARRKKCRNRISGVVVHGKGHGHLAGMPTANLEPFKGERWPEEGVWECNVYLDGRKFKGLTNVGLRPSDDQSQTPTIETLILDFSEDIYGHEMTLEFIRYIRKTLKFASLEELKAQIDRDIELIDKQRI